MFRTATACNFLSENLLPSHIKQSLQSPGNYLQIAWAAVYLKIIGKNDFKAFHRLVCGSSNNCQSSIKHSGK